MASLIKRGKFFHLQYYAGTKLRRHSLRTTSPQIAKEKLRQFESAKLQGQDSPLPTRTPLGEIVGAYVEHIRSFKTPKSAQTDVYYLRQVFGPVPAMQPGTQVQGLMPLPLDARRRRWSSVKRIRLPLRCSRSTRFSS